MTLLNFTSTKRMILYILVVWLPFLPEMRSFPIMIGKKWEKQESNPCTRRLCKVSRMEQGQRWGQNPFKASEYSLDKLLLNNAARLTGARCKRGFIVHSDRQAGGKHSFFQNVSKPFSGKGGIANSLQVHSTADALLLLSAGGGLWWAHFY